MFQYFIITLLKWKKYKNKLTTAYYSISLWDFKSLKCSKNLTSIKNKQKIFWKMSKYRNAVFHDFKSRFLVTFSSNYQHRIVLKIPFSDHIFLKISKYRTKNLHFTSTDKYDTFPPPVPRFALLALKKGFVRPHLDCADIIHD